MDITRFYESLWTKLEWKFSLWLFRFKDRLIELFEPWTYRADERLCINLAWRYAVESNQLEGLDRLMDAATILEGVPDELFNLKRWREKTDCGTVGCVAHHYAVARPKSGLTLTATDSFGRIMLEFHGATAMQAMADLFNIERKEALHLFSRLEYPGHYSEPVSRQQVIDRIRAFVAKKRESVAA